MARKTISGEKFAREHSEQLDSVGLYNPKNESVSAEIKNELKLKCSDLLLIQVMQMHTIKLLDYWISAVTLPLRPWISLLLKLTTIFRMPDRRATNVSVKVIASPASTSRSCSVLGFCKPGPSTV